MCEFFEILESVLNEDDHMEICEFIEPWVRNTGYPVLHITWRTENAAFLTQVRVNRLKTKSRFVNK